MTEHPTNENPVVSRHAKIEMAKVAKQPVVKFVHRILSAKEGYAFFEYVQKKHGMGHPATVFLFLRFLIRASCHVNDNEGAGLICWHFSAELILDVKELII